MSSAICRALKAAAVEFIDEHCSGPGVRLRNLQQIKTDPAGLLMRLKPGPGWKRDL
jgi:hypothetical protein